MLAEGAILATTWSFWIVVFPSLLLYRKLKIAILITALVGMVIIIGASIGGKISLSMGKKKAINTI